jgi:hypothetical protein
MALPEILGILDADSIRGLARNLFPGFWERGISANQSLNELKGLGLGYRRQDFLADFRVGKVGYDQSIAIRNVNLDNVPSDKILEAKYFGVPDKYSLVFKAIGIDAVTGEETDRYFMYHRDSMDTRANLQNDAMDWLSEQSDTYGFQAESITIREGYINPIWA